MKISLTKGYHLTSTERKHISLLIDANVLVGLIGRKHYALTYIGRNKFVVIIKEWERDDYGRKKLRRARFEIKIK